jgi:hypothetical protein
MSEAYDFHPVVALPQKCVRPGNTVDKKTVEKNHLDRKSKNIQQAGFPDGHPL